MSQIKTIMANHFSCTLESGIDVGQGINVGHEENVQSYVTKNPSNLKISVGHRKISKI